MRRANSALSSVTLGMPVRAFTRATADLPIFAEDSALFPPPVAGNRLQSLEMRGGGRQRLALDRPIVAHQLFAARRQRSAAACLAAGLRRHQRLGKAIIDVGDQLPG